MRVLALAAVCALAVAMLAGAADATFVKLYDDQDYQIFGTASIGGTRSQHFSPSESTPNSISQAFNEAGFWIRLDTATEALNINLKLYPWVTNYATSVAQTPIAQMNNIALSYPFDGWVMLTFPQQPASGQYLLDLYVNNYVMPDTGWQLRKATADNGGPNNDAFNNGVVNTTREYQVGLTLVPEPASLTVLAIGICAVLRRRR